MARKAAGRGGKTSTAEAHASLEGACALLLRDGTGLAELPPPDADDLKQMRQAFAQAVAAGRKLKSAFLDSILAINRGFAQSAPSEWLTSELVLHRSLVQYTPPDRLEAFLKERQLGLMLARLSSSAQWTTPSWSDEWKPGRVTARRTVADCLRKIDSTSGSPSQGEVWLPSPEDPPLCWETDAVHDAYTRALAIGLPLASELNARNALDRFRAAIGADSRNLAVKEHTVAIRLVKRAMNARFLLPSKVRVNGTGERNMRVPLVAMSLRSISVLRAVQREAAALHHGSDSWNPEMLGVWAELTVLSWYGIANWIERLSLRDRLLLLEAATDHRVVQAIDDLKHSVQSHVSSDMAPADWHQQLSALVARGGPLAEWAAELIGVNEDEGEMAKWIAVLRDVQLDEAQRQAVRQLEITQLTRIAVGSEPATLIHPEVRALFTTTAGVPALASAVAHHERAAFLAHREAAADRRRQIEAVERTIGETSVTLRAQLPWVPDSLFEAAQRLREQCQRSLRMLSGSASKPRQLRSWRDVVPDPGDVARSALDLADRILQLAYDPLRPETEVVERQLAAWRSLGAASESDVLVLLDQDSQVPQEAYPLIWAMALERSWPQVLVVTADVIRQNPWAGDAWVSLLIDATEGASYADLPQEMLELSHKLLVARLGQFAEREQRDDPAIAQVKEATERFAYSVAEALAPIDEWRQDIVEAVSSWD